MEQGRDKGKFATKGDTARSIKSIRVSDQTWQKFGELSEKENLSRADFLEQFMKEKESLLILQEINRREENRILEKIREVLNGIEKNGENQLEIPTKEQAVVRRALVKLLDYLGSA